MINRDDFTPIGKVVKTHGVNGELSVTFTIDDFDQLIAPDVCVFFDIEGIMVPFFIETVRPKGSESLLVKLDGIDSQEVAAAFVGQDVYADNASIGIDDEIDPDNLYASDLIGYAAVTYTGEQIGTIDDVDDTTDNPLFIIGRAGSDRAVLIPVVDEFIADIITETKTVIFNLPEGLLEL